MFFCLCRWSISHNIDDIMNVAMYTDVLEKNLLPYARRKMPRNWIFQCDNDPKHISSLGKLARDQKTAGFNLVIAVSGPQPHRAFVERTGASS